MFFCYVDETGTPHLPGNTSHYVLAGLAIPTNCWKQCENDIGRIKKKYGLEGEEIHKGWLVRRYLEQSNIPDFESLDRNKNSIVGLRHFTTRECECRYCV